MTLRTHLSAPIVAALLAIAAPAEAGSTPSGDLARLQGTWTADAGPRAQFPVTLTIAGEAVTVRIRTPQGQEIRAEGEVRIDEAARPRALDWVRFTALDGQEMPEIRAIYELEGETLRVCNGGPNNLRPAAFRPGEGILASVVTFRRAKEVGIRSE